MGSPRDQALWFTLMREGVRLSGAKIVGAALRAQSLPLMESAVVLVIRQAVVCHKQVERYH